MKEKSKESKLPDERSTTFPQFLKKLALMRFGSKISTKQQITATDSQRLLESDPKHNRVDQKYHSKKHNPNDPEPINLRDRGL
ncbi:MAG: hypothetical protein JSV04_05005, partial [Candidatus Heimdallarchaeota archaeon]